MTTIRGIAAQAAQIMSPHTPGDYPDVTVPGVPSTNRMVSLAALNMGGRVAHGSKTMAQFTIPAAATDPPPPRQAWQAFVEGVEASL